MASYKRAIHTVGDYHLVWVLIGHTLQDTDGNFAHLTRLVPCMGKVAQGQECDAALFNQAGSSAGCVC